MSTLFKKILTVAGGLAIFGLVAPVGAHHSAAQFDFRDKVTVTGVVKVIRVENPHMKLILELNDAKGKRDVEFEGHSLNNFYRSGYRPNLVKIGDTWEITIAPRKDKEDGGYVTSVKTSDGHKF
jgi:hypothetical protein